MSVSSDEIGSALKPALKKYGRHRKSQLTALRLFTGKTWRLLSSFPCAA
ncbi:MULTISPECIES: hypothetical protein [Psychrobacter]|nr:MULTISPECIES: hypothetical protein [Psychrobacter]MCH1781791.1 hypothetical protein [Psychrobacter glaciei]